MQSPRTLCRPIAPSLTFPCTHSDWVSTWRSFPSPDREPIPMAALEPVQTLTGTFAYPRSGKITWCPRAIPAARTTPCSSASPLERDTDACVELHVLSTCSPRRKTPPEVLFLVRKQPAQSVSLYASSPLGNLVVIFVHQPGPTDEISPQPFQCAHAKFGRAGHESA